jgi:hypothetical protein
MKQQITLDQWLSLTPGAQRRWVDWCTAHDYAPPAVQHRARWEDLGRLWHAPTIGQLLAYLAEHGRLDHDRWGLVVLPCELAALAGLCDALWRTASALLEG